MTNYTHQTAPGQFVETSGIRFAYRRFGAKTEIPLLFFMHLTGTMDHRDPALTGGFAQDREVILFNNAGISSSSGEVPTSIEEMARHDHPSSIRCNPARVVVSVAGRVVADTHNTLTLRETHRLFYETERSLIASKKLSSLGALL